MQGFEFGWQRVQVGSHQPGTQSAQHRGLDKILFDHMLLLAAWLAGRRSISRLCRVNQLGESYQGRAK
ncbi:MAG: hypothetical protein A3H27_09840 [Acidobacteria bacterium RIFCSPLOWO2_02_FULL_59_13]|nr:MAG: hypothetical protein A3H27_09840 [Acidobacteria bacterium RIFCSPLOWO2_02_FULL_59_13]